MLHLFSQGKVMVRRMKVPSRNRKTVIRMLAKIIQVFQLNNKPFLSVGILILQLK